MSKQFPGGIISKTAPTPSGSFENSTAPGIWTLEQQAYWQKLGQWPIPGNTQNFIEDVFSTYLYTGSGNTAYNVFNGVSQNIVNNINLSEKGGMVWTKGRNTETSFSIVDTVRGANQMIGSNVTTADQTTDDCTTSFNSNGYTLGVDNGFQRVNFKGTVPYNYVSWTFRKQPKFFDVVTYTGNATAGRTVAHNLGSVPGCIIIKKTTGVESWAVYHRSLGTAQALRLNLTNAASSPYWNGTSPTDTVFTVDNSGEVNDSGATYVAYLFAHDAGGFGNTGTDNVISCGSKTLVGSGVETVTLGYEPQWVLWKFASSTGNWHIVDVMRGMSQTSAAFLVPNSSGAEAVASGAPYFTATSTGFSTQDYFGAGEYIYIAIRRGPMKVPTVGTSVFNPAFFGTSGVLGYLGSVADMNIQTHRNTSYSFNPVTRSRLVGGGTRLTTSNTDAQVADSQNFWDNMIGVNPAGETQTLTTTVIDWTFKRAPSFFDVVCYTGTGSAQTLTHNLTVAPELIILKSRTTTRNWVVYPNSPSQYLYLNATDPSNAADANWWNSTAPTSSVFSIGAGFQGNESGARYVSYLFATCVGVSKVGSYTGTATTQQINCGFTAGSRFVLIKRTDDSGDWYVWDSARGIVAGDDPYLLLNSTAAEVTNTDYVDTYSAGFEISSTAPAAINANGGTFIFLAIA